MKYKYIALAVLVAISSCAFAGTDKDTGEVCQGSTCNGGETSPTGYSIDNSNVASNSNVVNQSLYNANTLDSSATSQSNVNFSNVSNITVLPAFAGDTDNSDSDSDISSSDIGSNDSTVRREYSGEIKIKNTPSMGHYAPDPTISCYKTGGVTISLPGFGGAASGGTVDEKCEMREMIRLGLAGDDLSHNLANKLIQSELYKYLDKDKEVKETKNTVATQRDYLFALTQ